MNKDVLEYEYSDGLRALLKADDYIMSDQLLKRLDLQKADQKIGMSDERIGEALPALKDSVAFWREYPDKFIDAILPKDSKFNLFFYQRLFLRAAIRHKYCYATFPRAFSKSFLAVMILIIRCILYPGAKLFIVSGTKEQKLFSLSVN